MGVFEYLLNTENYPARWDCGNWASFEGWLHIVSNGIIFLAYTSIPITFAYFLYRRPQVGFRGIFWLFALFIFACGTTHLLDAIIFWEPYYRLWGVAKAVTAIVSTITAVALVRYTPQALELHGVAEANAKLSDSLEQQKASKSKLKQINQKLMLANKDLETFAYATSHDLREPLRKAGFFQEMLLSAKNCEERADYSEKLRETLDRMNSLVGALLELSKTSQYNLEPKYISVVATLNEVKKQQAVALEEASARIRLGRLHAIDADATLFQQLIYNLLENSLKYRDQSRDLIIDFTSTSEEGKVFYRWTDNGIGFAAEKTKIIFEPFRRLHTSSQIPGAGIGLAMCKKIVEAHAGTISAESIEGRGTTILFDFPAAGSTSMNEQGLTTLKNSWVK